MESLMAYLNSKLKLKLIHLVKEAVLLCFTLIPHIYEVHGLNGVVKLFSEYKTFVSDRSSISRFVSVRSSDEVCDVMACIGRYSRVRFTRLNPSWYYNVGRAGLRHISSENMSDLCVSPEEIELVVSAFNRTTSDKFVRVCDSTALRMSYLRELQFLECEGDSTFLYFNPDINELMPGEHAPGSLVIHSNPIDMIANINSAFDEELRLKASLIPLPFDLACKIVEMAGRY